MNQGGCGHLTSQCGDALRLVRPLLRQVQWGACGIRPAALGQMSKEAE